MSFYNGWTLLFTRYLTIDVDTMHGQFCENYQTLTCLNLSVQHHRFQFFAKRLRLHRMPPVNSDEYFYFLVGFLASPQPLHVAEG